MTTRAGETAAARLVTPEPATLPRVLLRLRSHIVAVIGARRLPDGTYSCPAAAAPR